MQQERAVFDEQVAPFRRELHAHCYRMLGSVADADDALQEALLGAWRGLAGFEGRSSLRVWLYRIATNACLQQISRRPKRALPTERWGPSAPDVVLEPLMDGDIFLEPYPEDPEASFEARERVELAFVAALQHLPATQRAALILRDVVELSAAEVAAMLETSSASVESALQRARKAVTDGAPTRSQQATLAELGDARQRELVQRYISAWWSQDGDALAKLLTDDVRFSMPPIPNWFDGRDAVVDFFAQRVFATPWRLEVTRASGQLAFACYQGPDFRLGALNVISLRGDKIADICGFLDPALHRRFFDSAR
jgi:RNA polymerase sigma-70 factor (TIGR02960 family)